MGFEDFLLQKIYGDVFAKIVGTAKRVLQEGPMNPVFIMIGPFGQFYHVNLDFADETRKRETIEKAGSNAAYHDCNFAFFVSDIALGTPEQKAKGMMPLQVPLDDRREALLVIGWELTNGMKITSQTLEYKRSGKDRETVTFIDSELSGMRRDSENGFFYDGNVRTWFENAYRLGLGVKILLKGFKPGT